MCCWPKGGGWRRRSFRYSAGVMPLELYLAFIAATAVLMVIPGPNVALIVANSVAKNGSVISGDTAKMMIVKMDPAPNMGDSGTGTGKVVAQLGPAL